MFTVSRLLVLLIASLMWRNQDFFAAKNTWALIDMDANIGFSPGESLCKFNLSFQLYEQVSLNQF